MRYFIKHMVSSRCITFVTEELQKMNLPWIKVELGIVEFAKELSYSILEKLKSKLCESGLELQENKKSLLNKKLKATVKEMIVDHENEDKFKYSSFLSKKLGLKFAYLANIFSEANGISIQHYIINQKIEKIKELLIYDKLSISEISYKLNYSSIAHLCSQFKKVTGISPSTYKISNKIY